MAKNRVRLRAKTTNDRTKFTARLSLNRNWRQQGALEIRLPSGVSEPMTGQNPYHFTKVKAAAGEYKVIANLVYVGPTSERPTAVVRIRSARKKRKAAKKK